MQFLLIILCSLSLLGLVAALVHRFWPRQDEPTLNPADMECCGQHEVCEKESLLAAISKQIEYYNDEELDRFKGYATDAYSEADTEEFREVLYTMKSEEVAGWLRSLQLRQIELPEDIRDEAFLIVGERRTGKSTL